jgi:hypothetical protein
LFYQKRASIRDRAARINSHVAFNRGISQSDGNTNVEHTDWGVIFDPAYCNGPSQYARPCIRTNQVDFDEEVPAKAV